MYPSRSNGSYCQRHRCRERFETWHRPSWNRDLDPISDEELRELMSATCPACGQVVALDTLVVADDVWTVA